MVTLPQQNTATDPTAHMVVCGDDALAHRLAGELRDVFGEQVTLVVPPAGRGARPPVAGRARASALLGRVSAAVAATTSPNGWWRRRS